MNISSKLSHLASEYQIFSLIIIYEILKFKLIPLIYTTLVQSLFEEHVAQLKNRLIIRSIKVSSSQHLIPLHVNKPEALFLSVT